MLNRSKTKVRLKEMLSADKEELKEETRAAFLRDLAYVCGEYFELCEGMNLALKRTKNGLEIDVLFQARRVKNFTLLK